MSNTEQGREEILQLQIDALSLEISTLMFIALQKATIELGMECFSTDSGTVNTAETLSSMLFYQSLAETEAIEVGKVSHLIIFVFKHNLMH